MIKRILVWLLALALMLGTIGGGFVFSTNAEAALGWIRVGIVPPAQSVESAAQDLTLVCPGAAIRSGGVTGTRVGTFDRLGKAVVDFSASLPSGTSLLATELLGPSSAATSLSTSSGKFAAITTGDALALRVSDPNHLATQSSELLAATNYQVAAGSSGAGLLGAACQRPTGEAWLLGADTTIGREALLLLANATPVDLQVNLRIARTGTLVGTDASDTNTLTVPALSSLVVPVASLAIGEPLLALHLTSNGAPFAAWIQQKTVRGTTAAGIDWIAPSPAAAETPVIPGFFKRGTKSAVALIKSNSNYRDLTPAVALCSPGGKPATAIVQVIGTTAKTLGTVLQQTVSAGACVLSELMGLKDGNYSVFVKSDQPILGALRVSRTDTARTPITDFAWLTSASTETSGRVIAVPKSGISKFSIANPTDQPVVVTLLNLSTGESVRQTIGALNSVSLQAAGGSVYRISATQNVAASLVVDIDGQLSVIPLANYANLSGSVLIETR